MATDGDLEMAHARERFAVQRHLVEAEHLPAPLVAAQHAHHDQVALFNGPLAADQLLEGLLQLAHIGFSQKAQMAGVDREHRHAHRRRLPRCGEHRAITAQHDRHIHR